MGEAFDVPRLDSSFDPRLRRAIEALKRRHGGGAVSFGASADRPTPSNDNIGSVYIPTNAPLFYVSDGVSWRVFDPRTFQEMTPPILADWGGTTFYAAGQTLTQGGDDLYMFATATGALQMAATFKTAPTPPYTITACFRRNGFFVASAVWVLWRAGTGGSPNLMAGVGVQMDAGTLGIYSGKWTNVTTYSATYAAHLEGTYLGQPNFLRIADDGADRHISISDDGVNFNLFHSVARTDFLTPTQVGVGWYSQNALQHFGSHWLSWRQE